LEGKEGDRSLRLRWILGRKFVKMARDEIISGSCPMAGFGISGVEPSGCSTTLLATQSYIWKI
jgi:hypothetical protein